MSYLFLGYNFCVIIQYIAKHIATHALPGLIIKVFKEWVEMFQFQNCQDIVVSIDGDFQKSSQLL